MSASYYALSEEHLMSKNPLYAYRIPLAIIVAIVVSLLARMLPGAKRIDDYLTLVIVPLAVFVISLILIEQMAKMLVPENMVREEAERMRNTEEGFWDYLRDFMYESNKKDKSKEVGVNKSKYYNSSSDMSSQAGILGKNTDIEFMEGHGEAEAPVRSNLNETVENTQQDPFMFPMKPPLAAPTSLEPYTNSNSLAGWVNAFNPFANTNSPPSLEQDMGNGCMLGSPYNSAICSGDQPPAGFIAPVPSPVWQVQNAKTVAERLLRGHYVAAKAPFEVNYAKKPEMTRPNTYSG